MEEEEEIKVSHEEISRCVRMGRKIEAQRIKKGWRYIKVASNLQVLVPCDKQGKPTKEGERRLERQRHLQSYKSL